VKKCPGRRATTLNIPARSGPLVVGVAMGKIKATNKPFKDDWVFDITVRNGKVTKIREYIDTQALARASEMDAPGVGSTLIAFRAHSYYQ
jgi:hypothetical protein